MRAVALILAVAMLAGCRDEGATMTLPGGLDVERAGTLMEEQPDGETWMILQVLAPGLAGQRITAADMAEDTLRLCTEWGLPAAREQVTSPDQIVVQIMSEMVERGTPAPDVTQVFAGYRLRDGACIWEDF